MLNIILNAVFIYGWFGLPAMGVRGAALATLIARIVELTWAIASSWKKGYIHPQLSHFFRINRVLDQDFARCALPLLGASLFWGVGFTSYSAFMGHLGTDATAANSVAAVVRDLICCFSGGISSAGGIMVGNELGGGNLARGREYGDRLVKISFLCGITATVPDAPHHTGTAGLCEADAGSEEISDRYVARDRRLYDRPGQSMM